MKIVRGILVSVLCVVGAHALPANAVLITAGTETFNVDFTSAMPYNLGGALLLGPFPLAAGQNPTVTICTDFNGGGTCYPTGEAGPGTSGGFGIFAAYAGFTDGLFSVVLTLNTGSLDIASLTAEAIKTDLPRVETDITLIPSAIPEPATLALLALGLSGVALTRRRRTHERRSAHNVHR